MPPPFAFSPVVPLNTGRVAAPQISAADYFSNVFTQGMHDSVFGAIMQMTEYQLENEGPMLSPEEANAEFGLPSLQFDSPIRRSQAALLRERKESEMSRAYYLGFGNTDGLLSVRGLSGLGVGAIASTLNPLDLALNFVPIVGTEAAAAKLAKLGGGAIRQSLARGFITEEMMAARKVPELVQVMINAGAGNVMAEVPHFIAAVQSKEDYGPLDSLLNVAAGTAIGTGIHVAVKAAGRVLDKLSPSTREAMLNQAINQTLKGEEIRVHDLAGIDNNFIREKVQFDEESARKNAILSLNEDDLRQVVRTKFGDEPKAAAVKLPDGTVKAGTTLELSSVEGVGIDDMEGGAVEGYVMPDGTFKTVDEVAGHNADIDVANAETPGLPPYLRRFYKEVASGEIAADDAIRIENELKRRWADERFFDRPDIVMKMAAERRVAVQRMVDQARERFTREQADKRAARSEDVQAGKTMAPKDRGEYTWTDKTHDQVSQQVKAEVAELQAELKDTLDPADKAAMDAALVELDETRKAIDSMVKTGADCVIKNGVL